MLTRHHQCMIDHAASNSVFNTPELLESILSSLDSRTLLISAQRVSRHWHAATANSLLLQRILQFQPWPQQTGNDDRVRNPLLAEAFPAWFASVSEARHGFRREAFTGLAMCKEPARKQGFMRPKASWRRMLVSQPPIEKLGCWMSEYAHGCIPDDSSWKFKILEFDQGLRMGKLYDLSQRWMGSADRTSFAVYWTPKDAGTLQGFFYLKVHERENEALHNCGAAVDLILRGERWDAPPAHSESQCANFRRRFAYKGSSGIDSLEPTRDSGYKPATQWVTELVSM